MSKNREGQAVVDGLSEKNAAPVSRRVSYTKKLCYIAILTSISALFNIYTFPFGLGASMAVSFTYIPNFFAGAFFGPIAGLATGLLGDLIGCWLSPKGPLNPIILLASGLMGLIPAVVFKLMKCKEGSTKRRIAATIIGMIGILCICTVLNTIGLWLFYFRAKGRTLGAVFAMRMGTQTAIWAINFVLVLVMQVPVTKALKALNVYP